MNVRKSAFVVCIHDVMPVYAREIFTIVGELRPLIGRNVSLAVTPFPWTQACDDRERGMAAALKVRSSEILLHGFNHQRRKSLDPVSWLIGRADEFADLSLNDAAKHIEQGQEILQDLFGKTAKGFAPPGWRPGKVRSVLLNNTCGIEFVTGLFSLELLNGEGLPVAIWSWDCGVLPCTGYAGELLGRMMSLNHKAVQCVVLHPMDVRRGLLPRALDCIRKLLNEGREPVRFQDLIESRISRESAV